MTLFIVLASLLTYFGAGLLFVAPFFVERGMEYHLIHYPSLNSEKELRRNRRELCGFSLPITLIWPLYLIGIGLIGLVHHRARLTDVEQMRIDERKRQHIRELEKDLGY